MATKKNKAKKNTSKKKRQQEPWEAQLNLPPEIIQLYRNNRGKRESPLHYVTNTCSTKWRVPTTNRCISKSTKLHYPEFRLLADSSGAASRSRPKEYFYGHYIPHNATLPQPDATDGRRIMVYDTNKRKWTSHEFYAVDPFDWRGKCMEFTSVIGLIQPFDWRGKCMEFTSVIGLIQSKFCALTVQGALAVVERVGSSLLITGITANRAVPSGDWRLFKEQLFQMDNDVFLILFVHERSVEVVDRVEVFRLCFDELKWVKIEGMKGKTVFMDRRCCWVDSGEIGCRGDCVYFTQGEGSGWWVYDMHSCCISVASIQNDE